MLSRKNDLDWLLLLLVRKGRHRLRHFTIPSLRYTRAHRPVGSLQPKTSACLTMPIEVKKPADFIVRMSNRYEKHSCGKQPD